MVTVLEAVTVRKATRMDSQVVGVLDTLAYLHGVTYDVKAVKGKVGYPA